MKFLHLIAFFLDKKIAFSIFFLDFGSRFHFMKSSCIFLSEKIVLNFGSRFHKMKSRKQIEKKAAEFY
jgi:hypothetical protein